jgi:hypothetical protein
MASILEDLKGILSPAEYAKLEARTDLATRLSRGDELRSYYDNDEVETPPAVVTPPAARQGTPPPPGQFDLSAFERVLDARLGTINTTIETKIADAVKTRGDELVNNAVKISIQRADELNRIYYRAEKETGAPFDSAKFNDFLESPAGKAARYPSITAAYEAFVAPVVTERTIATKVAEGVKAATSAQSGQHVPGTTPGPSTNKAILTFQRRTATGAASETTGAGRAAAQLDRIMARRDEMAS